LIQRCLHIQQSPKFVIGCIVCFLRLSQGGNRFG
jgi:hypothetical protein